MKPRHPSWETMQLALKEPHPTRFKLAGSPACFFQVNPAVGWVGLLVEVDESISPPASPLAELTINKLVEEASSYLAIGTTAPRLYQECFSFLLMVADAIQLDHTPPMTALNSELAIWEALLRPALRLTRAEEIGLFGELCALARVVDGRGNPSATGWIAGDPESHDFRFSGIDLEVKTTTRRDRVHTINHPSQVVPLTGHRLFLLSVQIAPAGYDNGRSLPEQIEFVACLIGKSSPEYAHVAKTLQRRGYRPEDAPQYQVRYRLRDDLVLVPIDAEFPALTGESVADLLGARAHRVSELRYAVKVDGLGWPDGHKHFLEILPSGSHQ